MKRKFLLLMLALIAMATTARSQVVLNETNFPDANFRAALATILKISEGDEITEAKIAATTSLKVNSKSIADLTGIEHFTALTDLECYNNQLTSLDMSKNTALKYLSCSDNQLTALDVSNNTALQTLYCYGNQLTSLDMSNNTALTYLSCYNNQLTLLDVSKNTALTYLYCYNNPLTTLDVSQNTALTDLYCHNNQLTALDVSQNTALTSLACSGNQLTALDVSKNIKLWYLYCDNNQLTSLDVSKNTKLWYLWCHSNQIKGEAMDALVASLPTVTSGEFIVIDTKDENEGNICTKAQVAVAKGKGWKVYDYNGGNYPYPEYEGGDDATGKLLLNAENFPDANFRKALAKILGISEGDEITEAKIAATTTLNVSKSRNTPAEEKIADLTGIEHFTALGYLSCFNNQLTSLDVSKNTALKYLLCYDNQLTSLDVSNNTELTGLYCDGNQLSSLDVSNNTKLTLLVCYDNQLTSLDVSKNTALKYLSCDYNQLTSLDVSQNTALTDLSCGSNQLALLDVSQNTALEDLSCGYNQLTSLDVSKNTALTDLSCNKNQLTSLDLSKNTALTGLYCYNNQLTSLDVSKNTALTYLSCGINQLTALDVSNNTALTELNCYSNQIKGEAMDALVASLPTVESGSFYVINTKDENEGNVCTKAQVAVAKEKGWTVYDYNYDGINWIGYVEYEGSDEAILLDEENFPDDNFRNALSKFFDIPENYEITGDLISVTTKLDISNNQITNTIGIEHLTSLEELWCHCNIIAGEAMAKLIVSLTNLNISEAKGLKLTEETNPRRGALYALDFTDENEQNVCTAEHVEAANAKGWTVYCKTANGWQEYNGEIPTGINTVDSGELTVDSWYTIDGKKLAGEPKEKGIYIRNGRKVVK